MNLTIRFVVMGLLVVFCMPAKVQSETGMAAMQYYVGKWSCLTGAIGRTPHKTVETYTIESGIMREVYTVPVQRSIANTYTSNILTAYNSKNERYVAALLDASADWIIADVTLNGNVEQWTYRSNSAGKPGRGTATRGDHDHFTFISFPSLDATKPDFKETCQRS